MQLTLHPTKRGNDMSRYEVLHEDKGLAFGDDRACGEFLQIWHRSKNSVQRRVQDQYGPNPEDMIVDVDTMTDEKLSEEGMKRLLHEHGFEMSELEDAYNRGSRHW